MYEVAGRASAMTGSGGSVGGRRGSRARVLAPVHHYGGMIEQALVGGMDPGRGVVRIGDTVRRPGMRAAVRELLLHLEQVGFGDAPRYLGIDEKDRHVVSWVDGDVPVPPYPDWAMADSVLVSLGRLVRDYHDAVASFSPVASDW